MGDAGGPGQPAGPPADARRKYLVIGLFLVATFGMALVLSFPVSHLVPIRLPLGLPGPIGRALNPVGPLLEPPLLGRAPTKVSGGGGSLAAQLSPGGGAPVPRLPAPQVKGPPPPIGVSSGNGIVSKKDLRSLAFRETAAGHLPLRVPRGRGNARHEFEGNERDHPRPNDHSDGDSDPHGGNKDDHEPRGHAWGKKGKD